MNIEKKATLVSSTTALFLTLMKLFIGIFSNSVSIIASAIDSLLDFFVSIFNYFAIKNSQKPADDNFNYGRGKIEAIACFIEGTIIIISGIFLFYTSIQKAINNEISLYIDISIIVMIISLIITILLVIYLNKIAIKTNNLIIKTDALHYKIDIYTSMIILISLILINLTNYYIIDSILASCISIYIIYSSYPLVKKGILILLDKSLDKKIVNHIKHIITNEKEVTTYHMLKTRESSNQIFVDVHLVFHCLISLLKAHKISDKIEDKIRNIDKKRKWNITIHLDPYDDSKEDNIELKDKNI